MDNNKQENLKIDNNGGSEEFVKRFLHNRRFSDIVFYSLLVAYVTFIVIGFLANILIVSLVLRQRSDK